MQEEELQESDYFIEELEQVLLTGIPPRTPRETEAAGPEDV